MTTIIGRQHQYKLLTAAFGNSDKTDLPELLFLFGLSSSGKSYILEKAVKDCGIVNSARVSAVEAMCGRRPFLETILRQLEVDKKYVPNFKCETTQLFLRMLNRHYQGAQNKRIVIIINDVENLRSHQYEDLLQMFLIASELTQINLCLVFCSSLPVSSYFWSSSCRMKTVAVIHFPQYNKDEMTNIISSVPPHSADVNTFRFYVTTLVNVFFIACRDLKKLWRLAVTNYAEFNRPMDSLPSNSKERNLHKLWKNIEPKLKKDFATLSSQYLPINTQMKTDVSTNMATTAEENSDLKFAYDLPEYSKYFLIAAFLASHNPPSSDRRFFVKGKSKAIPAKDKHSESKVFNYTRLMAIFSSICSHTQDVLTDINTAHMSQITTLCDARLLVSIGVDTLDNMKFRCLADYELIKGISESLKFELNHYLYHLI